MERKVATVLFADLVGSTALGEQDPERTRLLLDRFFAAMREEVERVGGTVEKYAGDAVMAAFGAPAALEDHAERALHAALAMRQRLGELDAALALRIGVNTGEIVVDGDSTSTFVTGDAVNVCARLEQNAQPGQILVGERTAQAARGAFEFGDRLAVAAKGKTEPVQARTLVRALAAVRPRGGFSGPFVGRDAELAALAEAYVRACELRQPQLALVLGEAGVGKSRLVRELWAMLEQRRPRPLLRVGRCLSYGSAITYWPIREIVRAQLGLEEDVPAHELHARLGPRAALGLALGLEPPPDLHPLAGRDRFRDAWVELLDEAARAAPLVLVVEDVHWAEEPLLELLERTIRDVRAPVLVVATARPDLEWSGGRRNVTTVELEPLAPAAAAALLAGLPEEIRAKLLARAEGNPFFVEELVESLIDRGVLRRRDGGWEAADAADPPATPDSVRAVLAARIDLLPAREKAALQAAAVIGRAFWERPVRELTGGDADFALLEDRGFIRRSADTRLPGDREHAFKHALTREAAYEGIPKARRARLHASFAAWIEGREFAESLAPLLAHHYAEAVRPELADLAWAGDEVELRRLRERAVVWLRATGEAALARYELDAAISLLHRALELDPDDQEAAAIWRQIGRGHAFQYDGEPFWTAMENSLRVCHSRETCAETYAELAYETATRSGMWPKRPEDGLVLGWIDQALELATPGTPARAKALLARAFWTRGNHDAALEAAALAAELGDPELRAAAGEALTINEFGRGSYAAAVEAAERALALVPALENPDGVTNIYETSIPAYSALGRFDEAAALALEHQRICERLSSHHRVHGYAVRIEVDELCGRWRSVLELAAETAAAVDANLATPCIRNARSLLVVAAAAEALGDAPLARRYEERAEEVATEGYDVVLAAPRARLRLLRGDVDGLDALVTPFDKYSGQTWFALANGAVRLDLLVELGETDAIEREAPPHLGTGTYLEPFALRALGRVRGDPELVRRALERFEALGVEGYALETRALL